MRRAILYAREKYALLVEKKYSTIAGTLVFFLIMSVTPFLFWLTLLFGKMDVDTERVLSLPVFDSVKNVLLYIRGEAMNAHKGASVFLLATTLYSSTGFFYHLRRSGEIVYGYTKHKHGWLLRIGALGLMLAVMLLAVLSVGLLAGGAFLFSRLFPRPAEIVADYALMSVVSFFIVWLFNAYVCPYKTNPVRLLPGTFVTVFAWSLALIGFRVYLYFGNMGRLYGALSAIIASMLWLYVLMICFVAGVAFNSERVTSREEKKL